MRRPGDLEVLSWYEPVAVRGVRNAALPAKRGEGFAKRGGTQTAELAQLLRRLRRWRSLQDLKHPLGNADGLGLGRGRGFARTESQRRALLDQFQRHIVTGSGGPVLDGKNQVRSVATQVEVGVAPAVQVARTAQGLSRPVFGGALAHVMDKQHRHRRACNIDGNCSGIRPPWDGSLSSSILLCMFTPGPSVEASAELTNYNIYHPVAHQQDVKNVSHESWFLRRNSLQFSDDNQE